MTELSEKKGSLWILIISPTIWAAHFLVSYITVAIWCEKVAGSLAPARLAIAALTVLALAGIGYVGWKGYRMHRFRGVSPPHDHDTPASRHRFLGFATLLLSGLSAVAVIYAGIVALFIQRCY